MPARRTRLIVPVAAAVVVCTATAAPAAASAGPAVPPAVSVAHSCTPTPAPGHATCFALRRTEPAESQARSSGAATATPSGYGPADLQAAYQLPSATRGSGQRIYIVDANNDPTAESDLRVYRNRFGLPPCTTANGCFRKLNQSGARSPLPATDPGWAQEISLDLDMVSASCPKCAITLVEAKNSLFTNLMTAAGTATSQGAKFVSMSFGGAEFSGERTLDSSHLASSGVVYVASTGDAGYGAQYPAASNRVVAVGGTVLKRAANARGWTEKAWSGGGSGCSVYEPKPSWQSAIGTCSRRAEADVAAVAGPSPGLAVYLTTGGTGWETFGGTSAGAPIVTAAYAMAGVPSATAKPPSLPYAHRRSLFDVTAGSNGSCGGKNLCTAGPGWDGPTGLGTPKGVGAFAGTS